MSVKNQGLISAGYNTVQKKKDYFISLLSQHPEGIVAYNIKNGGQYHAVLMTDYDSSSGTFYCADPSSKAAAERIAFGNSSIYGSGQDGKFGSINSIWYISNKSGGNVLPVGKTSKPSVSVDGQTVNVSWSYDGSGSSIAVYLIQEPWAWADIKYTQVVSPTSTSCSFDGVVPGYYRAFTIAQPNEASVQSEWTEFTVQQPHTTHTWDAGVITTQPTMNSPGIRTYTCTICGAQYTEEIPAGITGTCGEDLRWYLSNGMLTISGNGAMWDFSDNKDAPWYSHINEINEVRLENGVTSIGKSAFEGSETISTVRLADTVTSIGPLAFMHCHMLDTIVLPTNMNQIGHGAFYGCHALRQITLPEGITAVEKELFSWCEKLDTVNIPDSVTCIESGAFYHCEGLSSLRVPEGVRIIEQSAFSNCIGLRTIWLPRSTERIDTHAFENCTSLADVYYAGSLSEWNSIESMISDFRADLGDSTLHCAIENTPTPTPTPIPTPTPTSTPTPEPDVSPSPAPSITPPENSPTPSPDTTKKFDDVSPTAYYSDAVTWAVQNKITGGTGNNKFSPNMACTRAQIVTFLWNAMGQPSAPAASFSDMTNSSVFNNAISWAVEAGITGGTGNNKFSPNAKCTRVQAVTFLWIAAGKPLPSKMATFSDMTGNFVFDTAISWAVENRITGGTGNNKFSPKAVCSRAQIVTFLYNSGIKK